MSLIKDIINKIKSIFKKNKVQKLDKAKEIEVVEKISMEEALDEKNYLLTLR